MHRARDHLLVNTCAAYRGELAVMTRAAAEDGMSSLEMSLA